MIDIWKPHSGTTHSTLSGLIESESQILLGLIQRGHYDYALTSVDKSASIDEIVERRRIPVPDLDTATRTVEVKQKDLNRQADRYRSAQASRMVEVAEYHIDYEGSHFIVKPALSEGKLSHQLDIIGNQIRFDVRTANKEADEIRQEANRILQDIATAWQRACEQLQAFNTSLPNVISQALVGREKDLQRRSELGNELNRPD